MDSQPSQPPRRLFELLLPSGSSTYGQYACVALGRKPSISRHLQPLATTIGEKVRLVTPFREFQNQAHNRGRGRAAEDDGVAWLEGQGFTILARNVATRLGEIDVVALDNETLCFVEIKARSSANCGEAAWAVPPRKQRQIGRVAALYLARHPYDGPCRFDVLAMDSRLDGWRYTLIRNAFELA